MGVAQPRRPVAALGDAAAVTQGHRGELGTGEEPAGAADVEDLTLAADLRQILRRDPLDELGKARPVRSGPGLRSTPGPWIAARCLGAASARSIFLKRAACAVERVNRP
jgi:hypothetical protein